MPYRLDQVKFKIPIIEGNGWPYLFDNENWMSITLKTLIPLIDEGAAFYDVGANIGQTLLRVRVIAPQVTYVGFEPNPFCTAYLHRLVAINSIDHVQIVPFGLSDHTGPGYLQLYSSSEVDSSASLIQNFRNGKFIKKIMVPVMDPSQEPSVFEKAIGILKIDTEGSELEVLEKLKTIIKRDMPFIICEILPAYNEQTNRFSRQIAIQELLKSLDYEIHRIQPDGKLILVSKIEVHSDVSKSNYLFIPKANNTVGQIALH